MRRRAWLGLATLGMLLGSLALRGAESAAAVAGGAKPGVESLAWLAGTWRFERNGRVVTERWTEPAGGMMLGTSQTIASGHTLEYEFIALRADAAGDVFYVAKPSGQAEASFKLVRAGAREAVFENPQHDFPQRISYVLKDDGTLLAAIEGTRNGKTRRVEFPYRRVAP
jgi:hypothetical protein